jgi:hypothetical protein
MLKGSRLVIASIIAFAVAGCTSSNHGISVKSTSDSTVTTSDDQAVCQNAEANLADYQISRIVVAIGGSAAQVENWIATRPESQGVPGGPDRGLSGVASEEHVSVCVYQGYFPVPMPSGPVPDGGRFIVLPSGQATMDTAGPLSNVLALTPSSIPVTSPTSSTTMPAA